jgi:hypothetical protein
MFPNVRLLIAATFASILVVILGFGMLAAVRVNHAPLVRLPPTSAARLAADDSVMPVMAFAAVELKPLDHRFPASLPPSAGAAADSAAPALERAEGVDSSPAAPAAAPEHGITAAQETAAIVAPDEPTALDSAQPINASAPGSASATSSLSPNASPKLSPNASTNAPDAGVAADRPALAAAQPAQEPAVKSGGVVAIASEAPAAPEPQSVPSVAAVPPLPPNAPTTDPSSKPEPASAAISVAVVAPSGDRALPTDRAKPESSVAPADVVALAPPEDQTLPVDQAEPEGPAAPGGVAKAAAKTNEEPEHEAEKKTKHARGAARARHKHRASRAASSTTRAASQYASYMQSDFVTAPQWQQTQAGQRQPARSQRATVAARKPKDPYSTSTSSTDGAWPTQ